MFGKTDDLTILKTLTSTLNDSVKGYRESAERVVSVVPAGRVAGFNILSSGRYSRLPLPSESRKTLLDRL